MAVAKFVDGPEVAVETSIKALCMTRPHLQLIENTCVVVNAELDPTKVLLVSGGGSGHEPAAAGFVHSGWLSAAVPGGVFASPPSSHVTAAIDYLHQRQGCGGPGIFVIVMNYLGDILNFQFAVQEAKERGVPIETVLVADDVCFGAEDVSRRRGIAGTLLVHKILAAAADEGASLATLKQLASRITGGLRSLGASLSSCSLPGSTPTSSVPDGFVEVGLGIHGEKGLYQIPFKGTQALVAHLLGILLSPGRSGNVHECAEVDVEWKGAKVALLVNNLGSTTDIEMGIVAHHALLYLRKFEIEVVGVSVGRYMTALEMHGFSLTLLRFSNEDDTSYLFYERQPSLIPFTVPRFDVSCVPGPCSALQLAKNNQWRSQCNGVLFCVIQSVFRALSDAEDYLNSLDAAVGDGDMGSGVKRAATKAIELLPYLPLEADISKALALLAKVVADAFGGTSGPLYGAFLLGAAAATASASTLQDGVSCVDVLRAALKAGTVEVQRLGGAKKGDRTMVDVLEALVDNPQVNAAASVCDFARACVLVSTEAAAATALLPAKCGRSRYLQGKEVGRPDPGAQLIVLWIEAAANELLSKETK